MIAETSPVPIPPSRRLGSLVQPRDLETREEMLHLKRVYSLQGTKTPFKTLQS